MVAADIGVPAWCRKCGLFLQVEPAMLAIKVDGEVRLQVISGAKGKRFRQRARLPDAPESTHFKMFLFVRDFCDVFGLVPDAILAMRLRRELPPVYRFDSRAIVVGAHIRLWELAREAEALW